MATMLATFVMLLCHCSAVAQDPIALYVGCTSDQPASLCEAVRSAAAEWSGAVGPDFAVRFDLVRATIWVGAGKTQWAGSAGESVQVTKRDWDVTIADDLPPEWVRQVVLHELGHCISARADHLPEEGHVMQPILPLPEHLTPADIEYAMTGLRAEVGAL